MRHFVRHDKVLTFTISTGRETVDVVKIRTYVGNCEQPVRVARHLSSGGLFSTNFFKRDRKFRRRQCAGVYGRERACGGVQCSGVEPDDPSDVRRIREDADADDAAGDDDDGVEQAELATKAGIARPGTRL